MWETFSLRLVNYRACSFCVTYGFWSFLSCFVLAKSCSFLCKTIKRLSSCHVRKVIENETIIGIYELWNLRNTSGVFQAL